MDNIKRPSPIELSVPEMWFLMSQFSPAYVLGMENPHLGWLIEEIEEADRTAVQALIQKGMVKIVDASSIELDDNLASMISGCTHPEHSLIVNSGDEKEKGGFPRYIHFSKGLIIEHIQTEMGRHQLLLIKDQNEIISLLKENLRPDSKTRGTTSEFFILEELLYKATNSFSQGDGVGGKALLQKSDLEPENSAALAGALENPVANASFVVIYNQNNPATQYVQGFGILESREQFWILRPIEREGKRLVEFTPADAKSIRKHFVEILP
jgi:hypothetical protein